MSNALLVSSVTVIVPSGGLFWLKPFSMVLFMLCSALIVEWLLLKPCCVEMCGMLFVMYGSSVFSSILAITEKGEMGLYDVPMFMCLFGFGIGMMFVSFHVCGMMLLFSDVLHMLVRYAAISKRSYVLEVPDVDFIRPCGVVVFALFYCRMDLCCGECYFSCLQFKCFPIYVSVCFYI